MYEHEPESEEAPHGRSCPYVYSHNCTAWFPSYGAMLIHVQESHRGEWPQHLTMSSSHAIPWADARESYDLDSCSVDELVTLFDRLESDSEQARATRPGQQRIWIDASMA
jgi:hypothetical protein